MKTRKQTYKLHNLDLEDYEGLASILRAQSISDSSWSNEGNKGYSGMSYKFLIPGRKVSLAIKIYDSTPYLHVTRNTLFQPSYVRRIVRKLGGELIFDEKLPSLDQQIDDYLTARAEKRDYLEFVRTNVRCA